MIMVIILWIIFSFIIGSIGSNRECGFFYSFMASLLFSPLIGAIYVALSERKSDIKMKEDIASTNKIMKLKELSELKDKGVLSNEEYEKLKMEIMSDDSIVIDPFKR